MDKHRAGAHRGDQRALRQPTQSRSRESTEALLEIGRRLIEQRGIDDCNMSEVAAAAGSSVGSLYFRFGNKERFVREVMRRQVDVIREQMSRFLAETEVRATSASQVIEAVTKWFVVEYGRNQGLLRAQLRRALDNPQEWQPFQSAGREMVDGAIRILGRFPDIQQDNDWQRHVRIAMQMVLGLLNNAVSHRPGPLELSDSATGHELSQAAIRYLRWDELPQAKLESTVEAAMRLTGRKASIGAKDKSKKKITT